MKTAYLQCFSGVNADMFLAALVDAGLPLPALEEALKAFDLWSFRIHTQRTSVEGIAGTCLQIRPETEGDFPPMKFRDIRRRIQDGTASTWVRETTLRILDAVARARAGHRNVPLEDIPFPDPEDPDSLLSVVGTVWGIEHLQVGRLEVSTLPVGSGFIDSMRGKIPLPTPVTLELLKGIPVFETGIHQQLVTPMGAGLVRHLAGSFGPMPRMTIQTTGYGNGTRRIPERPHAVRIMLGEPGPGWKDSDFVVILESNLDDSNPEWLGYLIDRLFDTGAFDVAYLPIQMKKNRPGIQIQVIGPPEKRDDLTEVLFRETGTLGIRFRYSQRRTLKRGIEELESPWGKIRVKKVRDIHGGVLYVPEYDSCKEIALKHGLPLRKIYLWVTSLNSVE